MRIILINHYAGSVHHGMEFRPYYLAKEWAKNGHDITIVAASYSHLRQNNIDTEQLKEEFVDGIRYIWLPADKYVGNTVKRFKNMLQFVRQLYRHMAYLQALAPDVVIASSTYPLDIYPAYKLAKKTKAQFVFELHDLWPLSPMELGSMSKYHPFIMLIQYSENFWCKHVDKVISILPNAEEYLKQHGLKNNKFVCIPNGIVLEDYAVVTELEPKYKNLCDALQYQGFFLIGYTGAHGVANALHVLLQAAAACEASNLPVRFLLVGQGQEKEQLKLLAHNLNNVIFLDSIPKKQIHMFCRQMDCLYIGLQKQKLFEYGVSPNKLMDYMMAGKPIVSCISAGNDLVQEAQCGISVAAENAAEVVVAIKKLMSMPLEVREQLGNNGKKYVIKNHDYQVLAQRFIDFLEQ